MSLEAVRTRLHGSSRLRRTGTHSQILDAGPPGAARCWPIDEGLAQRLAGPVAGLSGPTTTELLDAHIIAEQPTLVGEADVLAWLIRDALATDQLVALEACAKRGPRRVGCGSSLSLGRRAPSAGPGCGSARTARTSDGVWRGSSADAARCFRAASAECVRVV